MEKRILELSREAGLRPVTKMFDLAANSFPNVCKT